MVNLNMCQYALMLSAAILSDVEAWWMNQLRLRFVQMLVLRRCARWRCLVMSGVPTMVTMWMMATPTKVAVGR